MRSRLSIAHKIRVTAAAMFGKRNGSLRELRRGSRKAFTSSALVKPFLFNNSAIQGRWQISGQAIPAFGLSSAGVMVQRLCTNQIICAMVLWQDAAAFLLRRRATSTRNGVLQNQRRVARQNPMLFAEFSKHRETLLFRRPKMIRQTFAEIICAKPGTEFFPRGNDGIEFPQIVIATSTETLGDRRW